MGRKERGKDKFDDDPRPVVARFVIGNLPEIPVLKEMEKNKTISIITIGNEEWSLQILNNEDSKRKEIIFTKVTNSNQEPQCGVSVSQDYEWFFGIISGPNELPSIRPLKLAALMKIFNADNQELAKESLAKNNMNISKTAIKLKLSPIRVSQFAAQPIPPKQ
jgi:hypothetical protein